MARPLYFSHLAKNILEVIIFGNSILLVEPYNPLQCMKTSTYCSHLGIYILQKARLYVVNLESQFQTSLEAKLINLLIWKFRSIIFIFLLFFCRNCQLQCFLHTVHAISKRLKCLSLVFASNCYLSTSTLWNSSNSVQKALDFTTPAKNWRKMSIIDLNFPKLWNYIAYEIT